MDEGQGGKSMGMGSWRGRDATGSTKKTMLVLQRDVISKGATVKEVLKVAMKARSNNGERVSEGERRLVRNQLK